MLLAIVPRKTKDQTMQTNFCKEWFHSRKTIFLRSIGLFLLGIIAAGCPANNPTPPPAPTAGNKVVIRGSNTIGEELAPRLIAEYKKDHPSAIFDLETKATGYGLAALRAGLCDIAGSSRIPTKEEEEQAREHGIELNEHVIGAYSVAVIVNAANPVGNLTKIQVRDIFTGTIQNWKEVGGPDAPIHLYVRDPISGTYLGFQELAMENKSYAHAPTTATNYAGIVQEVAKDANGIGYSSIDLAKQTGAKAVSIDGVTPNNASVNESKYPYNRTLRLYTNKGKEVQAANDFIKFVQSTRGQEIVAQLGFVPHP
ncbi:MAG: phosphate binding protein [Pedosphaera sp.]|nr:phosphate binding protein [Pedosphaera sp.]